MRARRSDGRGSRPELAFVRWTKRSGGRFQAYEERIEAGSYSDDTQMIIAVGRSIIRSRRQWWETFAHQELPFWTLYERGGGGATKRSAGSWASGRAPWNGKSTDAARYFEAGGNGVAMRILPHVIRRATDPDFSVLAQDVVTDGVCTHGHPRALVGALAYAYALWVSIRHRGTLGFGEILDKTKLSESEWGAIPNIVERWADWRAAADRSGEYLSVWNEAVIEQRTLLQRGGGSARRRRCQLR
ncbi:ADP-ribosylglycohydrolase family protein [Sphingomonas sp. So64.6b]|uniref:ADP-ribosylglycohydrolase family protein n=1 Tax=Sphingomonas sp. So64.6b TaxID=2997354 RepID=UPI001FCE4FF5|nr:ADP-ribosylglycohydrolase family protein [Sphingomonas sp. So64.6b]